MTNMNLAISSALALEPQNLLAVVFLLFSLPSNLTRCLSVFSCSLA